MRPLEGERPGRVTEERVMAANEVAIVAVAVQEYSTGLMFRVTAMRSRSVKADPMGELELDDGAAAPERLPDEFLRFGTRDADGNLATNLPGRVWKHLYSGTPTAPVLASSHSSVGPLAMYLGWWRWPRPSPGVLVVACEWPVYGIAETLVELDTRTLTWHASGGDDTPLGDEHAIRRWQAERAHDKPDPRRRPYTPEWIPPHIVADAVRRARRDAGISVEELAERLGETKERVLAIEAGEVEMESLDVAHIGHVLGTGIHVIYDGMRLIEESQHEQ
jgi:DNA-binding XRE family transcriptional regulator